MVRKRYIAKVRPIRVGNYSLSMPYDDDDGIYVEWRVGIMKWWVINDDYDYDWELLAI